MIAQALTAFFLFLQSVFLSPAVPPTTTDRSNILWATTTGVVARVIDGDTIDVRLPDGKTARVRYIGMNTPEIRPTIECGGESAAARNRELVDEKTVTLVPGPGLYDKYHRRLAYVYVGDTFVNQILVAEGFAALMMIPPNTAYKATFEILESAARSKKQGIWSCPKSS